MTTAIKTASDLLPCPFCGHVGLDFAEGSTFRWIEASCGGCGATRGETRIQTLGEGTKDEWMADARAEAISEWNQRATLSAPPVAEGMPELPAGWNIKEDEDGWIYFRRPDDFRQAITPKQHLGSHSETLYMLLAALAAGRAEPSKYDRVFLDRGMTPPSQPVGSALTAKAREWIEEALTYVGSPSWSPSMVKEGNAILRAAEYWQTYPDGIFSDPEPLAALTPEPAALPAEVEPVASSRTLDAMCRLYSACKLLLARHPVRDLDEIFVEAERIIDEGATPIAAQPAAAEACGASRGANCELPKGHYGFCQQAAAARQASDPIAEGLRRLDATLAEGGAGPIKEWSRYDTIVHMHTAAPAQPAPEPAAQRMDDLRALASMCHNPPTREEIEAEDVSNLDPAPLLAKMAALRPAADAGEVEKDAGWQPIETAPNDLGSRLYLVGRFCVQGFRDVTGTLMAQTEISPHWRKMRGKPTHWMPLPESPRLAAPEAGAGSSGVSDQGEA